MISQMISEIVSKLGEIQCLLHNVRCVYAHA